MLRTPSAAWLEDLKRFDRELTIYWSDQRSRWVVAKIVRDRAANGESMMVPIYTVQNPDGSYREWETHRVIEHLWANSLRRHGSTSAMLASVEKQEADAQAAIEKANKDHRDECIAYYSKQLRRQLREEVRR